MLRKNPLMKLLAAALILISILGLTAVVYGVNTGSDPLVSLSYINGTFKSNLLSEVNTAIAAKQKILTSDLTTQISKLEQSLHTQNQAPVSNDFETVALTTGQTTSVRAGGEILFLSGLATASNAGLTDASAGAVLITGEALLANHLYVATGDCIITAAGAVKFLMK